MLVLLGHEGQRAQQRDGDGVGGPVDQLPARIEERADDGDHDGRVQPVDGLDPGDGRVGHRLGHGHGRDRQPGQGIAAEIAPRVSAQRPEGGHDAEEPFARSPYLRFGAGELEIAFRLLGPGGVLCRELSHQACSGTPIKFATCQFPERLALGKSCAPGFGSSMCRGTASTCPF